MSFAASMLHAAVVVALLWLVARVGAAVARRLHQPAVLGELAAGIILGPSGIGRGLHQVWRLTDHVAAGVFGFAHLGAILFLYVAGLEVDGARLLRRGRMAMALSLSGIAVPFLVGWVTAWYRGDWVAREPTADRWVFACFFATALSISALPVIAKTLMDLGLYKTSLGMTVMAAAIVEDVVGWIIFAALLGSVGRAPHGMPVRLTLILTLLYGAAMLTYGRLGLHRVLGCLMVPRLSRSIGTLSALRPRRGSSVAGALGTGLGVIVALLSAAFTDWVGVHAVFGAFLAGVAVGHSPHSESLWRDRLTTLVQRVFAPVFFAGIGLKVDFIAHFDLRVVAVVFIVACVGKLVGCSAGALWAGAPRSEALAMGFAMNARGAMEIILGLVGLEYGLIGPRLFVALVVMAWLTSFLSGPAMRRMLRHPGERLVSKAA